jgi:hypothetical protein
MIQMIKSTYGLVKNGTVVAMTKHSPPFSLSPDREAELVAVGVAVKVEDPEPTAGSYENLKMSELRRIALTKGVDVSGARSKGEVIAILEAAEATPSEE